MGGPVTEVLLRTAAHLSEAQQLVVAACAELGLTMEPAAEPSPEGVAVGRVWLDPRRDLDVVLTAPEALQPPDARKEYVRAAGYDPAAGLLLVAYTRDVGAARALARLSAALARQADDALVDLGGLLRLADADAFGDADTERAAVRGHGRQHVGVVLERPYVIGDGLTGWTHVVSADFLDSWVDDPGFHLVT